MMNLTANERDGLDDVFNSLNRDKITVYSKCLLFFRKIFDIL
jgi:hypothetical protein